MKQNKVHAVQYISKSDVVEEIKRLIESPILYKSENIETRINVLKYLLSFLDTIEVKDSFTWKDIRELYIIFAEIDTEIELCKIDIKPETLGYYQEALKRFKLQKESKS